MGFVWAFKHAAGRRQAAVARVMMRRMWVRASTLDRLWGRTTGFRLISNLTQHDESSASRGPPSQWVKVRGRNESVTPPDAPPERHATARRHSSPPDAGWQVAEEWLLGRRRRGNGWSPVRCSRKRCVGDVPQRDRRSAPCHGRRVEDRQLLSAAVQVASREVLVLAEQLAPVAAFAAAD